MPWAELGVGKLLTAFDGQEAYELAIVHRPDLILSDIKMPVMDGLTLCKNLSEIMVDVPVILMSAYEDFEYARTALTYGVKDYVLKPINRQRISELVSIMRDALEKSEIRRSCYFTIFDGSLQEEVHEILQNRREEDFLSFFDSRLLQDNFGNDVKRIMCIGLIDILYNYLEEMLNGARENVVSREEALRELLRIRNCENVLKYVKNLYLTVICTANKQLEGRDYIAIEEMKRYIETHYSEDDLSVAALSEAFHLTASYFSDFFKRGTGKNPNAYLTEIRIQRACEFLKEPFSKVSTVAGQVGFRDSLYFSKVFKKYLGMTPSEYQNLNRRRDKYEEN